ncbi:hypothetical protein MKW94_026452, partial [Papaver nudicaule]|nr:hypothetical protein [Papaver nudicaule]
MVTQAALARANLKEVPLVDKVLTRSNYGKWKIYMKNLLVSEYLWGVVSGGENSESPGYKMKNHTASVTLRVSCGKKMFNLILEQNNAHDAWLMLGAAFNVAPDEIKDSVAITIGSTLPPSPQVFSDYESWKDFMETYLKSKNLWGFLEVPSRLDPEQDEKALDAIKFYCGPHMRNIIPYVDCAKSAWVELEAERKEFQEAYETRDDEDSMRPGGMSTGPPEALTHTNYDEWSSHMTRYLKSLQLWEIVSTGNDNSSTTTASKSICKIKNACALKIIKDACEPQMLCCIFYKTSANKAWNRLKIKADTEKKEKYLKYSQLLHAVQKDKFVENIKKQDSKSIYYNWRGADKFFRDFPEALTAEITEDGSTALHIAVRLGRVDFVKELLKLMTPAQLETKTHKQGDTVLSVAAKGNYIEIVQMLADKNPYLLQIENKAGHSPLAMAATDGNEAVLRYLYDKTPQTMLWKLGVTENRIGTLLTSAARHEAFEVVLDLLKKLKEKKSAKLVFSQDGYKMNLLSVLARKPCAFPSGNKIGKYRRCIHWGGKQPLDCKVKYAQTDDILKRICSELPNLGPNKLKEALVNDAIHQSAIHGISEIFESLIDTNPYLEHYLEEETGRGLFQIAIMSRQESIYLYICQMGQRNQNIAIVDKLGNNTLHCAGFWIPSSQLDKAHGPALQMQREIQWYQ